MAKYIYQIIKARRVHDDKVIPDGVTMAFLPGTKIGVVGPNNTGKSSIFEVMAGIDQPSNGETRLIPSYSVSILPQKPSLNGDRTVLGSVEEGVAEIKFKLNRYNETSTATAGSDADFDALMAEMGTPQDALDVANAWDLDFQLGQAMGVLRCPPPDAEVKHLSGDECRRVALRKLLPGASDLSLPDEPISHFDIGSVFWLGQYLASYQGAVIAITHDRYFFDHVVEWITEVDRGHLHPYEGNYSAYLETKEKRFEVQGKKDVKLAKRLKEELEWVRPSTKGRQTRSEVRLARYEEMAAEAERTRKLDFEEIQTPSGPRLGSQVLEATNLKKGSDGRVLIDGFSSILSRSGIVGIVGPNNVGKPTLLKTIMGLEPLDDEDLKTGQTVKLLYVDQSRADIGPEKTLWEVISDGLDYIQASNIEMLSRAYAASFGFEGADQQKPTGVLSGGEHNRLSLALALKQGGNLILPDEPTNDLDVETLGSPGNALLELPGCAMAIAHDRWFLDYVATHILAWGGADESPASWYWLEGNLASYEGSKVECLDSEAARPHRVTYRKLARDRARPARSTA